MTLLFTLFVFVSSYCPDRAAYPVHSDVCQQSSSCCWSCSTGGTRKRSGQFPTTREKSWTRQSSHGIHPWRMVPIFPCQNWSHWYTWTLAHFQFQELSCLYRLFQVHMPLELVLPHSFAVRKSTLWSMNSMVVFLLASWPFMPLRNLAPLLPLILTKKWR